MGKLAPYRHPDAVLSFLLAAATACSSAPAIPDGADGGTTVPSGADPLSNCPAMDPPAFDAAPTGWAAVSDLGQDGTTGGEGGEEVDVFSTEEFRTHAERAEPLVIRVNGTIGNGARLAVGSHKTILGVGERPTVQGSLEIEEVQNVIVRNLYVVGNNCSDATECQGGSDAVRIADGAHHVWVDHLDVSDGSDGNLDVSGGSDYVTISWTKFSYSGTARGHRFSNLIGSGDCQPDASCRDRGKLRVTFHHNMWGDNIVERMPRTRYGDIHLFNNYYASRRNSYCIRAGTESRVLAEGNYFDRVSEPFNTEGGVIELRNNQFNGVQASFQPSPAFQPPYDYEAGVADGVPCVVAGGVGPH